MKSLFNPDVYRETLDRINMLTPETPAVWGKMDVAQMLHHAQKPLEIPLKKSNLKAPNAVLKFLFKSFKKKLYNDKNWKQGLRTAPQFVVKEAKDFDREKQELTSLIDEFHNKKNEDRWDPHPMFGNFTREQWGKMQYKHLDHHLRQFDV